MKQLLNILAVLVISFVSIVPLLCSLEQVPLSSPRDYLKYHNEIREEVWSLPLKWDTQLETHAHNFLNTHIKDCLGSKPSTTSGIGWNIARKLGNTTFFGTQAVGMWVKQKFKYDRGTNKCVGGDCRSYTQIIWKHSKLLGCARIKCHNNIGTLVRCNYDPPGNIPGKRPV
ncbi:hypothetical protein HN51_045716 [Arachis hypogaea]|uniref:SCP domain-containing protein n=1 Tax=Arachis hypogaea TaxID=3818 RepID=A0A444XXR3_ARAHY|nr:hypothetical protein Ahy_B08g089340 [Arachis hypogaea]